MPDATTITQILAGLGFCGFAILGFSVNIRLAYSWLCLLTILPWPILACAIAWTASTGSEPELGAAIFFGMLIAATESIALFLSGAAGLGLGWLLRRLNRQKQPGAPTSR